MNIETFPKWKRWSRQNENSLTKLPLKNSSFLGVSVETESTDKSGNPDSNQSLKILDVSETQAPGNDRPVLRPFLKTNYQALAQEIIREIRGEMSQRQLSDKLGYSFNQVGKWESGFTQIKWDDFLKMAEVLEIPMAKHFTDSFWTFEKNLTPLATLKAITHNLPQEVVPEKMYRNIHKKWLTGISMPDLSEVLEMIGTRTAILFGWMSLFLDCKKIPTIQADYEVFLKTIDAAFSTPVVVYVSAALQLQSYLDLPEHDEAFLAQHSACTIEELRHALALMLEYGLVAYKNKKFIPMPFDFSFAGLRHPKLRGLTKRSTVLAAERYPEAPIKIDRSKVRTIAPSSVRVVAVSKEASQKILELVAGFHRQIGEIVRQDDQPKDNVQVILVHSFPSNINTASTNLPAESEPKT